MIENKVPSCVFIFKKKLKNAQNHLFENIKKAVGYGIAAISGICGVAFF